MGKEKRQPYSAIFSKEKYKLIVLDMDGTLYYQRGMQGLMGMEMVFFAIKHPFSIWKLKTISVFRKIREQSEYAQDDASKGMAVSEIQKSDSLLAAQYRVVAEAIGHSDKEIQNVIEEWMFKRPLKNLVRCQDKQLCSWIEKWQKQKKTVVVYSDYPVKDKCDTLRIRPDAMYSSDEGRIGLQKPSAKGIQVICQDFKVKPEEILIIGDRYSKDGKMAEAAGCDYLILEKWKMIRRFKYK